MLRKSIMLSMVIALACSCRAGVEISGSPNPDMSQFEERVYDTAPDGQAAVRVLPAIGSLDELMEYRDLKREEAARILAMTAEMGEEKPYLPAVVTMSRPVTISEFNTMLMRHNASVQKTFSAPGSNSESSILKAEFIKGEDVVLPRSIRFLTTTGRGQLSYETMADGEQMARLGAELSGREEELNGISGFNLVEGITSFVGGVHRDWLLRLFDDPGVFLPDVGPIELYEGGVAYAFWDDLSDEVERYLHR